MAAFFVNIAALSTAHQQDVTVEWLDSVSALEYGGISQLLSCWLHCNIVSIHATRSPLSLSTVYPFVCSWRQILHVFIERDSE